MAVLVALLVSLVPAPAASQSPRGELFEGRWSWTPGRFHLIEQRHSAVAWLDQPYEAPRLRLRELPVEARDCDDARGLVRRRCGDSSQAAFVPEHESACAFVRCTPVGEATPAIVGIVRAPSGAVLEARAAAWSPEAETALRSLRALSAPAPSARGRSAVFFSSVVVDIPAGWMGSTVDDPSTLDDTVVIQPVGELGDGRLLIRSHSHDDDAEGREVPPILSTPGVHAFEAGGRVESVFRVCRTDPCPATQAINVVLDGPAERGSVLRRIASSLRPAQGWRFEPPVDIDEGAPSYGLLAGSLAAVAALALAGIRFLRR